MSLTVDHSRQENGREKRQEQLARWDESQTATISDDRAAFRGGPSKIKFGSGAIFLSACQAGDYDEIEAVLRDNDDISINYANSDGLTALHSATIDGNSKMVKYLISKGADINVQDHEGWSCLHAAASCGYVEIAKILVENNIDLLPVTSEGELAQDVAAEENPKMIKYLDELYASIDTDAERSKEEQLMFHDSAQFYHYYKKFNKVYEPEPIDPSTKAGPLHVAAAKGYLTVIKLLLEAGFSPHKQDADGWTPLHAACHWEQQEAAEYLAAYGANFNIRNSLGQRPIDVLTAQKLIPKIRDLSKNRPKRESLPELPELPPFSLPEPQPEPSPKTPEPAPEPKPIASKSINTTNRNIEPKPSEKVPEEKSKPTVAFANVEKDQRADSPWEVKLKQSKEAATSSPSVKKREKYGVQDDSISVKDSFRQFETSGREIRKAKRVTSSVEDSDQRHTGKTPVPGLMNEVERLNKAKKKRQGRQATTGVTLDVIKQAKELAKKNENKSASTYDRNTEPVSLPSGYIPSDQRASKVEQLSINTLLNPNIAKQEMLKKMLHRQGSGAPKTAEKKSPSETKKSIIPCDSNESLPAGRSASDSSTHTAVTRKQSAESSKSTTLEAPAPSARTRTTSDSRRNSDMEFPQHLSRIRSPVPDKNEESEIDYKAKYEDLKRKLEEQARRIQTLEAEKADLCKDKTALSDKLSNLQINGTYDAESGRLENLKLKQENAALIRIIAKVSK